MAPSPAASRPSLRARFFSNLWRNLAAMLGLMLTLVIDWLFFVTSGEGLPWGVFLAVAGLLVYANWEMAPILRSARQVPGLRRIFAHGYLAFGITTLLLGVCVLASWLLLYPLALGVEALAGVDAFAFFRIASVGGVATAGLIFIWGFTVGQALTRHVHVKVAVDGLAASLHGLRIVQVSDLHIGNGMERDRLAKLVDRVNALEPELIVLTGDLFDFNPIFVEEGAKGLGRLRAPRGVFGVLGNHDMYVGHEAIYSALERHAPHIRMLRGDHVQVEADAPLYIGGVEDPGREWTARDVHLEDLENLGRAKPGDGPTLLLVHRPEAFPQAARLGFEVVLAGHTHGGQIAMPGYARLNLARFITRYDRGLYRDGRSQLYVNRGAGVAGPAIRVNCSREITVLELTG